MLILRLFWSYIPHFMFVSCGDLQGSVENDHIPLWEIWCFFPIQRSQQKTYILSCPGCTCGVYSICSQKCRLNVTFSPFHAAGGLPELTAFMLTYLRREKDGEHLDVPPCFIFLPPHLYMPLHSSVTTKGLQGWSALCTRPAGMSQ